jgi:hypothetical protein
MAFEERAEEEHPSDMEPALGKGLSPLEKPNRGLGSKPVPPGPGSEKKL